MSVDYEIQVDNLHKQDRTHGLVVALVPAHNEERFIASVVLKTRSHVDQVVVIDDGSTDATAELAEAAGAMVIRHSVNKGKGGALNTGFRVARNMGADYVVMLDADGQHEPGQLAAVLQPVLNDEADLVIGSRYINKESDVPLARILGHRFFNFVTTHASGISVTDSQSGYRAFSRQAIELLSFSSQSFSVESEMQFLCNQHGLRVAEVPIIIRYQDKPKRSVIQHGMIVLNGILNLVGQYRPLLFFGVPGLFLLLVGLALGLHIVNVYQRSGELALGYSVLSAILLVSGLISLSTGVTLHSIRGLLLDQYRIIRDSANGSNSR